MHGRSIATASAKAQATGGGHERYYQQARISKASIFERLLLQSCTLDVAARVDLGRFHLAPGCPWHAKHAAV